jgi:hypothetical protein
MELPMSGTNTISPLRQRMLEDITIAVHANSFRSVRGWTCSLHL